MNATIAPQYRRPLTPTLAMFLAVAAIVIAVIALATTPSHTTKVISPPAPVTQVVPAAPAAAPAPAVATRGGSARVAPDDAIDCRGRRVGTMC